MTPQNSRYAFSVPQLRNNIFRDHFFQCCSWSNRCITGFQPSIFWMLTSSSSYFHSFVIVAFRVAKILAFDWVATFFLTCWVILNQVLSASKHHSLLRKEAMISMCFTRLGNLSSMDIIGKSTMSFQGQFLRKLRETSALTSNCKVEQKSGAESQRLGCQ